MSEVDDLPGPPVIGPPASWEYFIWDEAGDDEELEWWDELDGERYSIRCVRCFRDGRAERYGLDHPHWRALMPEGQTPSLEEINEDPRFSGRAISRDEFEAVWRAAPDAVR